MADNNTCNCIETEWDWTDERGKIEWKCRRCGVYLSPDELQQRIDEKTKEIN